MHADRIETRLMGVLAGEDLVVRGIENAVADTLYPVDLDEILGEWTGRVFWCVDLLNDIFVLWTISDPGAEFLIEGSFSVLGEALDRAKSRASQVRQQQLEFLRDQAVEAGCFEAQARLEKILWGVR